MSLKSKELHGNIPTKVQLPDTAIPNRVAANDEEKQLGGFNIRAADVTKHGFTADCPGCVAVNCCVVSGIIVFFFVDWEVR